MQRQRVRTSMGTEAKRILQWLCAVTTVTATITSCANVPKGDAAGHAKRGTIMNKQNDPRPSKATMPVHETPLSSIPPPDRPLPLLTPDDVHGLVPYPWKLAAIKDSGRSLIIVVPASPAAVKGAGIREAPDEVQLTIYGIERATGPATAISTHSIFLIQLPGPLGSRHINS